MHSERKMISIWFFIGSLLLAYGILVLGGGIYDFYYPDAHPVVLGELHAGIWWGILLLLVGGFYFFRFFPGKKH